MNNVTLTGRIGKDVELIQTKSESQIAKLTLATTDGYGDNKKTNWHNLVAFGKTAEILSKYVKKGSMITVSGRLDYNEYEKDGVKKYFTQILVNSFTFCDSAKNDSSNAEPSASGGKMIYCSSDERTFNNESARLTRF